MPNSLITILHLRSKTSCTVAPSITLSPITFRPLTLGIFWLLDNLLVLKTCLGRVNPLCSVVDMPFHVCWWFDEHSKQPSLPSQASGASLIFLVNWHQGGDWRDLSAPFSAAATLGLDVLRSSTQLKQSNLSSEAACRTHLFKTRPWQFV